MTDCCSADVDGCIKIVAESGGHCSIVCQESGRIVLNVNPDQIKEIMKDLDSSRIDVVVDGLTISIVDSPNSTDEARVGIFQSFDLVIGEHVYRITGYNIDIMSFERSEYQKLYSEE